jgi:hypothetical protein
LRYADLHGLPLARVRGSLTREEWDEATEEQRASATVLLSTLYNLPSVAGSLEQAG